MPTRRKAAAGGESDLAATAEPVTEVCGETVDGQVCNLPKGHDGGHIFVNPVREPETVPEAAERIFGEDKVIRPVIAKLARIMGDLPAIVPAGTNQHFGYGFIKDTQISGVLRPRMAKERLMIIPTVMEETQIEVPTRGGRSFLTKMKILFEVIDADSGDSITGIGFGYGDDAGDKGANKAFTAAQKYWLMKLFQIGGEDNESDAAADKRAAERAAGGPANTDVKVESANIEGIERGGRSTKMTATQKKQIFQLYKDLEMTPETLAERIETFIGDKLVFEENSDPTAALNGYLNKMDADDAGKLLSGLVDEKDDKAKDEEADDGSGYA